MLLHYLQCPKRVVKNSSLKIYCNVVKSHLIRQLILLLEINIKIKIFTCQTQRSSNSGS